ncbi:MAG: hypothetical protein M1830_003264, partial [Pleopsidium flavum]
LQTYLDGLAYSSPSYVNSSAYGTYSGVGGSTGNTIVGDDGIAQMKAEIRAVKGVLLSARNFPGSAGRGGVRIRVQRWGFDLAVVRRQRNGIAQMQAEIRALKGVLLGARNFPGSGGRDGVMRGGGPRVRV